MEGKQSVRVLVCRPGEAPTVETLVDDLRVWQDLVKGKDEEDSTISVIPICDGIEMICNDNGWYICEFNRRVPAVAGGIPKDVDFVFRLGNNGRPLAKPSDVGFFEVYGTFALMRSGGDSQASLTDEDITVWTLILRAAQS